MSRFLLFLIFLIDWSVPISSTILKSNDRGKFRIVQFTDLHYDDTHDSDNQRIQSDILDWEQPDLVVFTGDMIMYSNNTPVDGWMRSKWEKFVEPMVNRGIPWSITLGNHDDDADLGFAEVAALDSSYQLSLTQTGPVNIHGFTNYYFPIYDNNGTQELVRLWVFDSGDANCLEVKGYSCVYPDQVDWYLRVSKGLPNIPELAFVHIPLPEFMDVWNVEPCHGDLKDGGICCSSVNTGLYSAFKMVNRVKYVGVGHDHNNDFWGDYNGIVLSYGRKTGYGGYGPKMKNGARVIEVTFEPFKIVTWIREEDGNKVVDQDRHAPGSNQQMICCANKGHDWWSKEKIVMAVFLSLLSFIIVLLVIVVMVMICRS